MPFPGVTESTFQADENHLRDGLEIPFQPRAINHSAGSPAFSSPGRSTLRGMQGNCKFPVGYILSGMGVCSHSNPFRQSRPSRSRSRFGHSSLPTLSDVQPLLFTSPFDCNYTATLAQNRPPSPSEVSFASAEANYHLLGPRRFDTASRKRDSGIRSTKCPTWPTLISMNFNGSLWIALYSSFRIGLIVQFNCSNGG